jgi:hypothetical protein
VFEVVSEIIDGMNGVGSADRHAGSAIDAAFGFHVKLGYLFETGSVFFRMNAVGGADIDAKKVLDAGVGDHIGHDEIFLNMNWSLATRLSFRVRERRETVR